MIHLYHPLRGLSFPVLKSRTVSGVPTLILRGTRGGTFAIPREWTDWGTALQGVVPTVIAGHLLPALLGLTDQLKHAAAERKAAQKRHNPRS